VAGVVELAGLVARRLVVVVHPDRRRLRLAHHERAHRLEAHARQAPGPDLRGEGGQRVVGEGRKQVKVNDVISLKLMTICSPYYYNRGVFEGVRGWVGEGNKTLR
jgi:hypothetical protein